MSVTSVQSFSVKVGKPKFIFQVCAIFNPAEASTSILDVISCLPIVTFVSFPIPSTRSNLLLLTSNFFKPLPTVSFVKALSDKSKSSNAEKPEKFKPSPDNSVFDRFKVLIDDELMTTSGTDSNGLLDTLNDSNFDIGVSCG